MAARLLGMVCLLLISAPGGRCTLLDEILAQELPESGFRPRVVFDLDDTILREVPDAYAQQTNILSLYPGALVVPYDGRSRGEDYVFFPYFAEVALDLMLFGWDVDFFSHGSARRNVHVLSSYLKFSCAMYCEDAKKINAILRDRMRVFSRDHTTQGGAEQWARRYEIPGNHKKDLTVVARAALEKYALTKRSGGTKAILQDTILIDDQRKAVVGGEQYPFIDSTLPWRQEDYYANLNETTRDINDDLQRTSLCLFGGGYRCVTAAGPELRPRKNAYFVLNDVCPFYLGVLSAARDIMIDENRTLREAVSEVLTVPEAIATAARSDPENTDPTPWHCNRSCPVLSEDAHEIFVAAGKQRIKKIVSQRLMYFKMPENPYFCIGNAFYKKHFRAMAGRK